MIQHHLNIQKHVQEQREEKEYKRLYSAEQLK